jgi:hypothetical protein
VVDVHDVDPSLLTVSSDFHQPYSPSHASAPNQIPDAKYPSGAPTPNLETVPINSIRDVGALL